MNKNVIYLLDCQFEDEWHEKKYAITNILKKKDDLTEEYVSSVINSGWRQDGQDEWTSVSIPRIESYARTVGAEVVKFDSTLLDSMTMPSSFHPYQRAVFLKFEILRQFEKSNYDRMLFLDLDILILHDKENIFEELPRKGIYMAPDYNPTTTLSCKQKLWEFFKIKKELTPLIDMPRKDRNFYNPPLNWFKNRAFYNWGVFLADKDSIKKLNVHIPKSTQWISFFDKFNLSHNPRDSRFNQYIMEQDCLLYFIHQSPLSIKPLGRKWNFEHFCVRPNDDVNFVHMYDKMLISFLFDKPWKLEAICAIKEKYKVHLNEP